MNCIFFLKLFTCNLFLGFTTLPNHFISPESGGSRKTNVFARVDFPDPDSPTIPRVSPG